MALLEGQVYRTTVDGYSADGAGVARIEGMVVFVKDGIRGEIADVYIEHIGHNAAWGHIETLVKASPARVEPDCPYYENCGGCQFRHMTYEEELEAKRVRVQDALQRIGGTQLSVDVIHGAQVPSRYRNKVKGCGISKTTRMLAQKQPFIQRVRNSSLVERLRAENTRGSNMPPKLWDAL